MTRFTMVFTLVLGLVTLGAGCAKERAVSPDSLDIRQTAERAKGENTFGHLVPDALYSLAFSNQLNAYAGFELISQHNGLATPIWTLNGQNDWVPADPTLWGPSPVGLAFDLDGTIYTVMGAYYFDSVSTSTACSTARPSMSSGTPDTARRR